jgi:hypothetical protein
VTRWESIWVTICALSPTPPAEIDPKRIRLGLAIVSVVFLVSLVLAAIINDPLGRAVMAAIALSAIIRAGLLIRSVRQGAVDS